MYDFSPPENLGRYQRTVNAADTTTPCVAALYSAGRTGIFSPDGAGA